MCDCGRSLEKWFKNWVERSAPPLSDLERQGMLNDLRDMCVTIESGIGYREWIEGNVLAVERNFRPLSAEEKEIVRNHLRTRYLHLIAVLRLYKEECG